MSEVDQMSDAASGKTDNESENFGGADVSALRQYVQPTLTLIGNARDLLAGNSGSQQDTGPKATQAGE
jgi:hypothetical protein